MKTSGFTWFKHETLLFNPMNEIEMDVSKKSGFTPDLGTGSMMIIWLNWGYPMCTHS